jgi:hypothetical protein
MTLQALLARNGWLPTDTLTLNRIHEGSWQTIVITADKAQAVVDKHLQGQDAWYSVCPLRSDFQPVVVDDNGKRRRTRGTEQDVVGLLALWTDIDVKAGGMCRDGQGSRPDQPTVRHHRLQTGGGGPFRSRLAPLLEAGGTDEVEARRHHGGG